MWAPACMCGHTHIHIILSIVNAYRISSSANCIKTKEAMASFSTDSNLMNAQMPIRLPIVYYST